MVSKWVNEIDLNTPHKLAKSIFLNDQVKIKKKIFNMPLISKNPFLHPNLPLPLLTDYHII